MEYHRRYNYRTRHKYNYVAEAKESRMKGNDVLALFRSGMLSFDEAYQKIRDTEERLWSVIHALEMSVCNARAKGWPYGILIKSSNHLAACRQVMFAEYRGAVNGIATAMGIEVGSDSAAL